ncbi:MAG: radical SAM protein [Paludibacteraceae bacterium]|nr:radical SAM protein [Paludibacteraceae bacterium]
MNLRKRIIFELERLRRKNLQQLHPLQQLFWESTLRCNVHCLHCGSDCSSSEVTPDMPAEDFLRVIDQSVTPHVDPHKVLIIISGGEPLMRKDLAEVGAALKQRGYPWGMVTNGLALTEKRFKELLAAGLRSIAISFDGLELDHNWLRQHPLAFEGATRAIKLAAQYGVQRGSTVVQHSSKLSNTEREALNNIEQAPAPAEQPNGLVWDVVTCVNQRTINQLDEMQQYLWSIGVRNWRLITIDPMGRAAENPELILTPEQHRQLLDYIREKRKQGLHISYSCEGFMPEYEMEIRDHLFHCAAGISIASILIDGSISACTSVRGKYYQGNIYKDDFWEVWENGFEPYRNRKWMKKLEPCNNCKLFRYCEGGGMHLRQEDGALMLCHHNKLMGSNG